MTCPVAYMWLNQSFEKANLLDAQESRSFSDREPRTGYGAKGASKAVPVAQMSIQCIGYVESAPIRERVKRTKQWVANRNRLRCHGCGKVNQRGLVGAFYRIVKRFLAAPRNYLSRYPQPAYCPCGYKLQLTCGDNPD